MSRVAIKGNASGTGTFTLEAPAGSTDRTLSLPDEAGTVLTSASSVNGVNAGPLLFVKRSSDFSLSDNVVTKITWNSTVIDTDSCFSDNKFIPNVAGYYAITLQAFIAAENISTGSVWVYKNGSLYHHVGRVYGQGTWDDSMTIGNTTIVHMNGSTDYIEAYARINNDGCCIRLLSDDGLTYLTGHLVRAD